MPRGIEPRAGPLPAKAPNETIERRRVFASRLSIPSAGHPQSYHARIRAPGEVFGYRLPNRNTNADNGSPERAKHRPDKYPSGDLCSMRFGMRYSSLPAAFLIVAPIVWTIPFLLSAQTGLVFNVMGSGESGLTANYTGDLELHNVQLDPAAGASFSIQHSKDLEMDEVGTAKPLPATPVIRLASSPGTILRNSRAFPGTDVFLSADSSELKSIHLIGNFLDNARQAEQQNAAAR